MQANLQHHKLFQIHQHFEICKLWLEGKNYKKNRKSFLDETKNIFQSF